MALSSVDTRILKVVQVTHHQGDIRYGMSRGMQCSYMSLLSVCWSLFKSASIWTAYYKKGIIFLILAIIRYLGMEDLLQEFFLENSAINIEFLDNRTAEITAGKCLVSITEIVSDCQLIDTEALLILKKHILRLLWGNQCFYLFNSHGKRWK